MNNELYHHGIKGQRWGVRRFQNQDGTRTAAGKHREQKDGTSAKNAKRKNTLNQNSRKYIISTKTSKGEKVTIEQNENGKLAKFLGNHSSKIKAEQNKTLNMSIKNSSGKKVGDLMLYNEGKNSLNVSWIGINKKERGHGYASTAMKSVVNHAKKNGYSQITLEVPGNSPEARRMYEKIGFKANETISNKDDAWGGLTSMTYKINKK